MTQDELKQAVARAALDEIRPLLSRDTIIGVGTGSTANLFIDALAEVRHDFAGAVASCQKPDVPGFACFESARRYNFFLLRESN